MRAPGHLATMALPQLLEFRFANKQRACDQDVQQARLAQPAERKALNLVVVGSSPTVGVTTKLCVCLPLLALVISG